MRNTIVLLVGVLVLLSAELANALYTFSPPGEVSSSGKLPAESMWQGGAIFTFLQDNKFKSKSNADYSTFARNILTSADTEAFGFNHYASVLGSNSKVDLVESDTKIILTLAACPGFILGDDIVLTVKGSVVGAYFQGGTFPPDTNVSVGRNTIPGHAQWSLNGGSNEDDVRRKGLKLSIALQYNRFLSAEGTGATSGGITLSSLNDAYLGDQTKWGRALSNEDSVLTFSLPPLSTYNIASVMGFNVSMNTTLSTVVGNLTQDASKKVTPNNFTGSIGPVNDKPLVFCEFIPRSITERDLRQGGPVTVAIQLSPPGRDAFILGDTTTMGHNLTSSVATGSLQLDAPTMWKFLSSQSDTLASVWGQTNVTVNTTHVEMTIHPPPDYNIDQVTTVPVTPVPGLLASEEAGCPFFSLQIEPAAADVLGVDVPVTDGLVETDINDRSYTFTFTVDSDSFRADASVQAMVQLVELPVLVADDERDDLNKADYYGFVNNASEILVSVNTVNSRECSVTLPRIERLNIPYLYAETISLQFPGSAMVSGVAPNMLNATFNVSYVSPTVNATFAGDKFQIPYFSLWADALPLTFTLRGDIWKTAQSLWTHNHPRFAATGSTAVANKASNFNSFSDPVSGEFRTIQYSSVQFQGLRVAVLPMLAYTGLAISVNEHVDVTRMDSLIRGRSGFFQNVKLDTFFRVLVAHGPEKIQIHWSGDVTQPGGILETEARRGFWFCMKLFYAVFDTGYISNNLAELFASTGADQQALLKYLPLASVTFPDRYTVNVTFPPLPTFDVDVHLFMILTVPNAYYGLSPRLAPSTQITRTLTILANPSPTCVVTLRDHLTEDGVRQGKALMHITVQADQWVTSDAAVATLPGSMNSTFNDTAPMAIEQVYAGALGSGQVPTILVIEFAKNASYNIDKEDEVFLTLSRFFFFKREACRPVNFTVAVKPGTVEVFLPAGGLNETTLATSVWTFHIRIDGERLLDSSFPVQIEYTSEMAAGGPTLPPLAPGITPAPTPMPAASAAGFPGLVASQANQQLTAVRVPANSTRYSNVFTVTVQPFPGYNIGLKEVVVFSVPISILASGESPVLIGENTLEIRPVSSPINVTAGTNGVLTEEQVVKRSEVIVFNLPHDVFLETTSLLSVAQSCTFSAQDLGSSRLGCLRQGLLPLESYSLTAEGRQMIVTFPQPSKEIDEFDVVSGPSFAFRFSFSEFVTRSGYGPTPSFLEVPVMPLVPRLSVSGTALLAGSRDLALGGLQLNLYLSNSIFVPTEMGKNVVCVLGDVGCTTKETTARNFTVTFLKSPESLFSFNRSYQLSLPPGAVKSLDRVDNVTLQVYIQPGILIGRLMNGATVSDRLTVSSTVTEDQVRLGQLPRLQLTLLGDRFERLTQAPALQGYSTLELHTPLGDALASGIQCTTADGSTPSLQLGGFCGRRRHLFIGQQVQSDALGREATITLQTDADFDISRTEIVKFLLGKEATESGLAPIPHPDMPDQPLKLTVTPTAGKVYFSTTTSTLSESLIVGTESVVSKGDPIVTLSFTLVGDRWKSNPTSSLVSGFSSTSEIKREASGFERYKVNFFDPAVVSKDGRLLTLTMKAVPQYKLKQVEEEITFNVFGTSVESGLTPQLESLQNRIIVTAVYAYLGFKEKQRTTFSMEETRDYGFTVTLQIEQLWESELVITGDALGKQFSSSASPALEPTGFMALFDSMKPLRAAHGLNAAQLEFTIRPDSKYRINKPETIVVTVPPEWAQQNVARRPFTPSFVSLFITPSIRALYLYVLNPLDRENLVAKLALFVGVTTDMIIIQSEEQYGTTGGRSAFSRVRIGFSSSNATGSRSAEDAADFLIKAEHKTLEARTNISAVFYVDAGATKNTVDKRIGLVETRVYVPRGDDVIWIYCSIAGLIILLVGGCSYYHCYAKAASYSGMNRPGLDEDFQLNFSSRQGRRKAGLEELELEVELEDQQLHASALSSSLLNPRHSSVPTHIVTAQSISRTSASPMYTQSASPLKIRPGRVQPDFPLPTRSGSNPGGGGQRQSPLPTQSGGVIRNSSPLLMQGGDTSYESRPQSPLRPQTPGDDDPALDFDVNIDEYFDNDEALPTLNDAAPYPVQRPQAEELDLEEFEGEELDLEEDDYHGRNNFKWMESREAPPSPSPRRPIASSQIFGGGGSGSKMRNSAPPTRRVVEDDEMHVGQRGNQTMEDDPFFGSPQGSPFNFTVVADPADWMAEEAEMEHAMDEFAFQGEPSLTSIYPPGTPVGAKFGANRVTSSGSPLRKAQSEDQHQTYIQPNQHAYKPLDNLM